MTTRGALLLCSLVLTLSCVPPGSPIEHVDRPAPDSLRFQRPDGVLVAVNEPGVTYLVDFWALGCRPCKEEMPDLLRLERDFSPSGRFKFLAVIYGGSAKHAADAATQEGFPGMPVVADPDKWGAALGVRSFPTKFLIRDGRILRYEHGAGPYSYKFWSREISDLLGS